MEQLIQSDAAMRRFGALVGAHLTGGECIELVGDVGAGKTTFVQGLAQGLGITEQIQSPSFTISREYPARDALELVHYDFYRLPDAGILKNDLLESAHDTQAVTVIEWADVVDDVLPADRMTLAITPTSQTVRRITLSAQGDNARQLLARLKK